MRVKSALSLIFLLVFSLVPLVSAELPARPSGFVTDAAGVISESDERAIEQLAADLERNGSIELAVVTVDSLEGRSIEEFSYELATSWGIGDATEDTGVLLLLSVSDRKVRIEVGYGLEGDLTDSMTGRILDAHAIEPFKANRFSTGLLETSRSIAATLAEKRGFSLSDKSLESYSEQSDPIESIISLIVSLVFVFIFLGRMRLWPLLFLTGGRRYTHYGGGFGSAGRSGGFSGGFGGFSGGSFGGGGASRGF